MAKRRREVVSDDIFAEMEELRTVYVDTSLDTHLALLVSSADTVSVFKKKIILEHKKCFPTIGDILIHSVKVKRRSNFYHLPDIMLVWCVFNGVKGNWFLSADASRARTCHSIKTSCEFDASNSEKMCVTDFDDNCRGLSSDVNRLQTLSIPSPGGASEMVAGFKFEKSVDKSTDFQRYICSEENWRGTDSRPKKKRKVGNTEDACHNPRSGDDCNLFEASHEDTLIPEVVSSGNLVVDAVRKSTGGGILHEKNGKENDHFDSEDRVVLKGPSLPTSAEKCNLGSIETSQNLLASDEMEEAKVSDSKMDHKLSLDAPTNHSEGIYVKVPDSSIRLMDVVGGVGEVNADGSKKKKKKKKIQKTDRKLRDTTEMEQTGMGKSVKRGFETHESEKKEEEKGTALEHDHEVIMLSNSKASGHVDPESVLKEATFSRDADAIMEPEISSGIKKPVNTNLEQAGIEQTDNGTSGLCPSSTGHIPGETGKEEGITNHERSKKKKKKVQKTARNVRDTTEMEQTGMGESMKPVSEIHEPEKKEEEKGMSLEHGHEVIMLSNSKASGHVDPESVLKEACFSWDADAMMEPEISSGIKKKEKWAKKSVNTNLEQSGTEQTDNGTSGLCPSSTGHIPGETGKEEGITNREGKDVQVFDSLIGDAVGEVQGVNRSEGDSVILTQANQTLTDVRSVKKIANEMAQSSAGNCRPDLSAIETGIEFTQVHNKKKRKRKQKLTEDLTIEDQQVVSKALDSSVVLSTTAKEKLSEAHGIGENTYNMVETSEKKGEGINFKQYFVHGLGDKANESTKSNQERETSIIVKDNVEPFISNSTELQCSIKSFEKEKAENKSRMEGSMRSKEDPAQSSHRNEIITNSFKRSSGAFRKGAKDSRPSEMCEAALQKPDEVLAASSHQNKKIRRSSDKSTSERSEILSGKQGNERFNSGVNATYTMLMKTPQKKSLLTKPGNLFQYSSEESSRDDNGTMHSDGSTLSPSNSSSMSGHSGEESDLSQDSTRNGPSDAEGKSTGRRNMAKFDLSASTDNISMESILKSSKRFRKAKLQASQNEEKDESQPIEFVPDSQLS